MSTDTATDTIEAIRDDLGKDWHSEATNRRDGFILSPGQNGVVAVTVGSVGRSNSGRFGRTFDVLSGFMSDAERAEELAGITADLAAAGWAVARLGDVVVVDGRE